jgi:hypothetical protein
MAAKVAAVAAAAVTAASEQAQSEGRMEPVSAWVVVAMKMRTAEGSLTAASRAVTKVGQAEVRAVG